MGYYSGQGIAKTRTSAINPLATVAYKDANDNSQAWVVQQRVVIDTKSFPGVAYPTAQTEVDPTNNLADKILNYYWWSTGGVVHGQDYIVPNCKGTKKDVAYSQIGDSNLYERTETTQTLAIRVKEQGGSYGSWET